MAALATVPGDARAPDSRSLTPRFRHLPKAARVVMMPVDVEVYSLPAHAPDAAFIRSYLPEGKV